MDTFTYQNNLIDVQEIITVSKTEAFLKIYSEVINYDYSFSCSSWKINNFVSSYLYNNR